MEVGTDYREMFIKVEYNWWSIFILYSPVSGMLETQYRTWDLLLGTWSQSWWEYLCHGNQQMLPIRVAIFNLESHLLNTHQHTTVYIQSLPVNLDPFQLHLSRLNSSLPSLRKSQLLYPSPGPDLCCPSQPNLFKELPSCCYLLFLGPRPMWCTQELRVCY